MIDTSARLIAVSYVGEPGAARRVETATPILCRIDNVNRAEWFAAYNSGFRPEWRVTTTPASFGGQTIIDLDTPEGTVRCDVYRTYRKTPDALELWCCRKTAESEQVFTLWCAGKRVVLYGAYLTGTDGATRTNTGKVATDAVALILPQTFQAFCGGQPVAYSKPKAYKRMTSAQQAEHFYIDVDCFFALGDLDPSELIAPAGYTGDLAAGGYALAAGDVPAGGLRYQEINALYDDVWRVQSVDRRNRGKIDTEYVEVIGK